MRAAGVEVTGNRFGGGVDTPGTGAEHPVDHPRRLVDLDQRHWYAALHGSPDYRRGNITTGRDNQIRTQGVDSRQPLPERPAGNERQDVVQVVTEVFRDQRTIAEPDVDAAEFHTGLRYDP